jgi:hypothetical protein
MTLPTVAQRRAPLPVEQARLLLKEVLDNMAWLVTL